MRLSLYPFLPENVVSSLDQIGIRTDSDLLFSSTPADILRRLPPGTVNIQDLRHYTAQIIEEGSALGVRGDVLLALERTKQDQELDFASGVTDLDALLNGFGGSRVFEVSGEKASGKTALAMHVVLRHLVNNPHSGALWMDTTGDFSAERATQLIQLHGGVDASTALERLQVSLVLDIEGAHDVLEALPSTFVTDASSETRIRIIVIDSITPLLGPMLSAVSSQGHAIMTTFMRQLRALAQAFELCIFVINNATPVAPAPHNPHSAFSSTVAKPALGPSFAFLTDATIWLSQHGEKARTNEDRTTYIAEIFKSKTAV
ncbi:hypothetical protein PILCRDRAFT_410642 [Piloderma croceum F 1598]|uniref:RecA family profile 1 domain-containing protein n=1 Tax=Piloderma croceum (strain F 1598) TaxID=765440 RepID=A0A0C3C422_PILCF|nr:hypothetical protein PILCRDRAFT_410642 [Piloderma croceum F 1598]